MGDELLKELAGTLFESAPDAIVVVDSAGIVRLLNAEAERLLGYTRREFLGQSVERLVPAHARGRHAEHRAAYDHAPVHRLMGEAAAGVTLQTKSGEQVPVEIALSHVLGAGGARWTIAIVRDVRVRRELEERVRYLALHDTVTGAYNRAYFDEEMARLSKGRRVPIGILMADVDMMKEANDAFGHLAGDALLRAAAEVLQGSVRAEDTVARLGGDEFGVLLPGADSDVLGAVIARIREAVDKRRAPHEVGPVLMLSVGGAFATEPSQLTTALRKADAAMYADKRSHGIIRSSRPVRAPTSS